MPQYLWSYSLTAIVYSLLSGNEHYPFRFCLRTVQLNSPYLYTMESTIVNKVASSGLVTIDLEQVIPAVKWMPVDLAPLLFQGLVLREKDFREWVKEHDWAMYNDAHVYIYCSADAIVPQWAYMLVAGHLAGKAKWVAQANASEASMLLAHQTVAQINADDYRDARVVVKGCSDALIHGHAYTLLAARLQPVVKSLMFGEPCSTVPLYKRAQ